MKKFLVSTADAYGYDRNDNLLFVGKTLLDSSIETTLANTDVRAGRGNKLQYIYYHTAEMNVKIDNAQFSLEFLALNVGSQIETGADMFVTETVQITNGNGSIEGTPLALSSTTLYGWVTIDGITQRVTFNGQNFTTSNPTFTGDACVRYYSRVTSARQVTVYADMLPSTIRLVLETMLASDEATTNKIGTVEIEVPKASMTGAFTLNMTPDSVSQTPLTVRALATEVSSNGGCDSDRPVYAYIKEHIDNTNWYDDVKALAIEGGDFSLAAEATKTLKVFAIPTTGASFLAPIEDLTFATSNDSAATVVSGVVSGVAEGSATIKATITAKDSIDANVVVTVPSA